MMTEILLIGALSVSPVFFKGKVTEPILIKVEKPEIKFVESLKDLTSVFMLTYDAYLAMGYAIPNASGLLIYYPYYDHLPQTTILTASLGHKVVASVTYTVDGPYGLPMEDDFRSIINTERQTGHKIAGVWRLVVSEAFRKETRLVIALFHEICSMLTDQKVDAFFLTVNPDHVRVYKKVFQMEKIDAKRLSNPLLTAPAILMRGVPQIACKRWMRGSA